MDSTIGGGHARYTNGHGDPEKARAAAVNGHSRNGNAADESSLPALNPMAIAGALASMPNRVLGPLAKTVMSRIPAADLDERDPDYIRESLPGLWLLASIYFRGEVRGLGNIPEEGGVLLVGNHSGGNLSPDTGVFTLAFSTYFGV